MTLVNKIYVSQQSADSDDLSEIVYSNIETLNTFFLKKYVYPNEVPAAALQSYYVDYYLAQVCNGGFSQFIYNSSANPEVLNWVEQGLIAMEAEQHLALFRQARNILNSIDEETIENYLSEDYFGGDKSTRDLLNTVNSEFFKLNEAEALTEYNGRWLKNHHDLYCFKNDDELEQILHSVVDSIPDLPQRKEREAAQQPRYVKLIKALSEKYGLQVLSINAGNYINYEGERHFAYYFSTDKGVHYMLDFDDEAAIFSYESNQEIGCIDASGFDIE